MEVEDLNIFIHPIHSLVTSTLIMDLRVNYPNRKLIFYGATDSTVEA
jgi:hypothetical protein